MSDEITLITCKKCSHVSIQISKKSASAQVRIFNRFVKTLSKKEFERCYGGKKMSLSHYKKCINCNNSYKNFKNYNDKKDPNINGHTLNMVLNRKE